MDPISIGVLVGTALISQSAKKFKEIAADPEIVAKSINWVFAAVDNFLKIRRKEKSQDVLISPPPTPTTATPSEAEIEQKVLVADEIVKSANQSSLSTHENGIKLATLNEFAFEQLVSDIDSLMTQIKTYLDNLNFEENKVALKGGIEYADIRDINTIKIQKKHIADCTLRLNRCMQRAYGVSAPSLETLNELMI